MADRTIYRLTEYDDNWSMPIKIVYSHSRKELEEEEMPTVSENQYIEKITFNANDMENLCNELNNDEIDKDLIIGD